MVKTVLFIVFYTAALIECNASPETTMQDSHRVARQAEIMNSEESSENSQSWFQRVGTWIYESVQKAAEAAQQTIHNIVSGVMTSGMPTSGPIQQLVG
ncbi:hypothetical protein TSAR_012119 [Trichomalopsis sarcophagae]|uniref:Uncharacterized protein n=1 Tax=Trichomalopsis sarcophagae TaxID=543379 RepID=A0A232EQ81_9HYME|nr:hypothetical protein TSAR_012119 [Trichomalopsis sarcophagae]